MGEHRTTRTPYRVHGLQGRAALGQGQRRALQLVRGAAGRLTFWRGERDAAIREAVAMRVSTRQIARAAGLSHSQVARIAKGKP